MKEYKRRIFWTIYFDSTKSRSQGRRIPSDKATRSPSLDELWNVAKSLGYMQVEKIPARHPKFPSQISGYVSVEKDPKGSTKAKAIRELGAALSRARGQKPG